MNDVPRGGTKIYHRVGKILESDVSCKLVTIDVQLEIYLCNYFQNT